MFGNAMNTDFYVLKDESNISGLWSLPLVSSSLLSEDTNAF